MVGVFLIKLVISGETISNDHKFAQNVNGITISPKKAFCIIKIWMFDCQYQDPHKIQNLTGLTAQGCLFKKHKPEY